MGCSDVHVTLLGGFELSCGPRRITIPLGAQRLLAFLAIHDEGVNRAVAAERLWPDTPTRRASANLRSALWRGRQVDDLTIIESGGQRLRLTRSTYVDLHAALARARRAADTSRSVDRDEIDQIVDVLRRELLPDWMDDWLVLERERWDQARLHLLEDLAQGLCSRRMFLAALQTALTATGIEPVRETAHRIVIEIHMAEGNGATALRHYQRYRRLLRSELGVSPSRRMAELADELMPS